MIARLEAKGRNASSVIETLSDGYVLIDSEMRFLYLSPSFERFSGVPPSEVIGASVFDVLHPDDVETFRDALEQVKKNSGVIEKVEFRGISRHGGWLWIEARLSNRFDDPDIEAIVAAVSDITDRVMAEQELATLHSRLIAVVDHTDECILLSDKEGFPVFFNSAYAKKIKELLGIDMRMGLQPHKFTPPAMAAQWDEFHGRVLGGESFVVEHSLPVGPEEELTFETMFNPVFTDGEVTGFAEIMRDITDRRRAEGELRETNARLATLLQAIPAIIYFKDVHDRHLVVNRGFEKFFGVTQAQAYGKTSDELYPSGVFEKSRAADAQVLKTNPVVQDIEDEMTLENGEEVFFESMKVPILNAKREIVGLVGISHDVSEQRLREADRLNLERQFHHAQKLESLGMLAGGVAHDFNNLLMVILGNIDLIQMESDPGSRITANIAEIDKAASRASDLCRQLLAYSGRAGLVFVPCDLSNLVEEMAKLLRVTISKKVKLELALGQGLPEVNADPTQMSQVVMNLITNASEAIGDVEGTILLTTELVDTTKNGSNDLLYGNECRSDRCIALEVVDTGCGIDREVIPCVFDPFFTTKISGRGLGLAAVQGIVHGHGGVINISSVTGEGTRARILIPVSGKRSLSDEPAGTGSPSWSGTGDVLVVDDEPSVLQVAKRLLERFGFDVLTASDGYQALAILDQQKESIRLVLLDIAMPRMDGLEMLGALNERGIEVPVILSSGRDEYLDLESTGLGSHIAGYIKKPYRVDELRKKLQSVLE